MCSPIFSVWLWAAHTVQRAKMAFVVTIIIERYHNMNNMIRKRLFASVPYNKTVTENVNTRKVYYSG
jgi:hypothetical protein